MIQLRLVALALISIIFVAATGVKAAGDSESNKAPVKSAVAGTYSCGFDAPSGYQAPGTNANVNVGGVFTLTIDSQGTITQGSETLSVDDGGLGPAVCNYGSGGGAISTAFFTGSLGRASLTYQSDNGNSNLCPSGDASIKFAPVSDGLKFIYTNSSGFTGQGTCGVAGPPPSPGFICNYAVKTDKGTGTGMGGVVFSPALNKKPSVLNMRLTAIFGLDTYPNGLCAIYGPVGFSLYPTGGAANKVNGQCPQCLCPTVRRPRSSR